MPLYTYKFMIRKKCKEIAYEYLLKKRGTKGRTANNWRPTENLLNKKQNGQDLFKFHFQGNNRSKCICQQQEVMLHIYECKYINSENQEVNYELI